MIGAEQSATRRSAIIVAFEGFRNELDEHNDRREFANSASLLYSDSFHYATQESGLLKQTGISPTCRRNLSFSFIESHRTRALQKGELPPSYGQRTSLSKCRNSTRSFRRMWLGREDGNMLEACKHYRLYPMHIFKLTSRSGGLQELIEALSMRHYLLHGEMISHAQVQQFLTSDTGTQVRSSIASRC